jgi:hypothetical protein
MRIHTLANGATLCSISLHGFKFSDGTESESQEKELVDFFTLKRDYRKVGEIHGMPLNEVRMVLDEHQLEALRQIAKTVDIVLVPFPVLTSLREQSVREQFPNVVAYNATTETQRSAPQDKVVDVNNWSY